MNEPYKFGLMLIAFIPAIFIGFFPHIFHWALIYILAIMAAQLIIAVHALLDWHTAHWRLVELRMETNYKLEGIEHALNQIAIYTIEKHAEKPKEQ